MRNALIHYGGYLLSAVGAVVGVSLLSYYVSPEQYGRVALYIAVGTLFQYVVRESLGAGILRYSENIRADKTIALDLTLQSSKWLLPMFFIVAIPAYFYLRTAPLLEFLMGMVLVFLLGLSAAGETFLSALHHKNANALHVNLVQWLRFLLAALFYVLIDQSVLSILAGFCAGFFLTVLFDVYIYRQQKKVLGNYHKPCVDNIFAGKTAIAIGILTWFLAFYERIALEWFHGETYLGAYFVLYQIGFMPVVMLMRSASTFIFPRLFVNGEVDTQHLNSKTIMLLSVLMMFCFLVLEILHSWLFSWLVGESYRQYSWLLPWLFLAAMLNACAYMLQAYYYDKESLRKLLVIKMASAISCFILVTVLVWQFAIQGLIAASVVVSLLLMLMSLYAIRK